MAIWNWVASEGHSKKPISEYQEGVSHEEAGGVHRPSDGIKHGIFEGQKEGLYDEDGNVIRATSCGIL